MNSLKSNSEYDRSYLHTGVSSTSQGVAKKTNEKYQAVLTAWNTLVFKNKLAKDFSPSYFGKDIYVSNYVSRKGPHASGDIHHSQFGSLEAEHTASTKSIVTTQFQIITEANSIVVPRELYIWEIIQVESEWTQNHESYSRTLNTTGYLNGVTAPIAWGVVGYTPSRAGIILHLSRPSTTQYNQKRTLKLSIGESALGANSSGFFIGGEQYVSWTKYDPYTGRTTTGGLLIIGHSAGNEWRGTGVHRISPASSENKTSKVGGWFVTRIMRTLTGAGA